MGFPAKVSSKDLARVLGISVQRVNQLAAEGVLRKGGRDQYERVNSVQSYVRFRENAASSEAGRHHGLSRERAQMVRTQRELAELELAERHRQLVDIDTAARLITSNCMVVRNKVLQLGAKLGAVANPVNPVHAEQVIYNGCIEALEALSVLEAYDGDYNGQQTLDA